MMGVLVDGDRPDLIREGRPRRSIHAEAGCLDGVDEGGRCRRDGEDQRDEGGDGDCDRKSPPAARGEVAAQSHRPSLRASHRSPSLVPWPPAVGPDPLCESPGSGRVAHLLFSPALRVALASAPPQATVMRTQTDQDVKPVFWVEAAPSHDLALQCGFHYSDRCIDGQEKSLQRTGRGTMSFFDGRARGPRGGGQPEAGSVGSRSDDPAPGFARFGRPRPDDGPALSGRRFTTEGSRTTLERSGTLEAVSDHRDRSVRVPTRASRINLERSPRGGVRQTPGAFPPGSDARFESPNGTLGRPEARPARETRGPPSGSVRPAGRRDSNSPSRPTGTDSPGRFGNPEGTTQPPGGPPPGQTATRWFPRLARESPRNEHRVARRGPDAPRSKMVLEVSWGTMLPGRVSPATRGNLFEVPEGLRHVPVAVIRST